MQMTVPCYRRRHGGMKNQAFAVPWVGGLRAATVGCGPLWTLFIVEAPAHVPGTQDQGSQGQPPRLPCLGRRPAGRQEGAAAPSLEVMVGRGVEAVIGI